MKLPRKITKQIQSITSKLIESSFAIHHNNVANDSNTILWSGYKNISYTLKDQPYDEIYNECLSENAYNFLLLDGAIIQIMYELGRNNIIKHRLSYFPHPSILKYQDSPEDYEELTYGNNLFSDISERKVITVPIRFDYDENDEVYKEKDHPYSHLTLGNYINCRIPVNKPITPNKFILFILRSFYLERYNEYFNDNDFKCEINLAITISRNETNLFHVVI